MRVHNSYTSNADTGASSSSSNTSGLSGQSAFAQVLAKLNTFTSGTPAEQMRAEILAQLGYTEDQLKAMPAKEREAVEKKIAELEKKEIDAKMQKDMAKSQATKDLLI